MIKVCIPYPQWQYQRWWEINAGEGMEVGWSWIEVGSNCHLHGFVFQDHCFSTHLYTTDYTALAYKVDTSNASIYFTMFEGIYCLKLLCSPELLHMPNPRFLT